MKNFNTFENQVNGILVEAPRAIGEPLNKFQSAMKIMTPGSGLFDGPGFMTNKYDGKKNYYPNIRARAFGLVNLSLDNATQNLINRINQLKQIETWDPNVNLPTELTGIISTQYSQEFIPAAEKEIEEAKKYLNEAYQRMPRDNDLEKTYNDIINTDITKLSPQEYAALRKKDSYVRNKLRGFLNPKAQGYTQMSMLQKAHIQSFIREFEVAFDKWFRITRTVTSLQGNNGTGAVRGRSNQQVDTEEERIKGTPLRKDITIYRDEWNNFLTTVSNGVIGASQQGWSRGASLYTLLVGGAKSESGRRGIKYSEMQPIAPDVLKAVHSKIMIPLFMSGKNNVMTYATPEQWESISQGGKLFKTATQLGRQAWTAGQNKPKTAMV